MWTADNEAYMGRKAEKAHKTRKSRDCLSLAQSYCCSSVLYLEPKNCSLLCSLRWLFFLLFVLSAPVEGFSILPSPQPSSLKTNMATTNVATPLYITVGPQCAGKTTLLTQLAQRLSTTIEDITLDHQRDVYVQVPTEYFLQAEEEGVKDNFLQRQIQGKTLASRIYNIESNGELNAILQRLTGTCSHSDFCDRIRQLYDFHAESRRNPSHETREYYQEMAALVIDSIQNVESQDIALPRHIQLYCVESLFRAHPETNRTGVEAAHDELWHVARNSPTSLAWGNTNTRPREYKEALAAAADTSRPVYFLVYADSLCEGGVFLPKVGLQELMRRNLSRFLQTGKYVPCRAMVEANDRVSNLVESAQHNLPSPTFSKLELDQELARMIHFEMNTNRTVQRMMTAPNTRKTKSRDPPR